MANGATIIVCVDLPTQPENYEIRGLLVAPKIGNFLSGVDQVMKIRALHVNEMAVLLDKIVKEGMLEIETVEPLEEHESAEVLRLSGEQLTTSVDGTVGRPVWKKVPPGAKFRIHVSAIVRPSH